MVTSAHSDPVHKSPTWETACLWAARRVRELGYFCALEDAWHRKEPTSDTHNVGGSQKHHTKEKEPGIRE